MAASNKYLAERSSFSKISAFVDVPDLLSIQTKAYQQFLQEWVPYEAREDIGLEEFLRMYFLSRILIEITYCNIKTIILVSPNTVVMNVWIEVSLILRL